MKTKLTLFLAILSIALLSGCSKDDDSFNYSMETLYGTWEGTEIYSGDDWVNITSWVYSKYQFGIKFYVDGTYYGYGYFGTGSGTYTATGNKIITYVSGEKYLTYTIESLTSSSAQLIMSMDGSEETIKIRVEKE
ncbi:MAG: hypothetical protein R3Y16_07990 [Rikenellaceae bacterium]